MLDPNDIVETIENLVVPYGINVFWLEVNQPRDRLKKDFDNLHSNIVVLILKSNLFQNPNNVVGDLIEFFCQSKNAFPTSKRDHLSILILAKNRLEIAQQSSPATLPSWFPTMSDQVAELSIQPLNFLIETSLSEKATIIGLLSSRVYKIEELLINRINIQYGIDKNPVIAYLNSLGYNSPEQIDKFIAVASTFLKKIINPEEYRILLKSTNSLVSNICSKHLEIEIASKPKQAKKLSLALGIIEGSLAKYDFSLQSLIQRPYLNESEDTPIVRIGMDIEELVFFVYQLMNGIAHRDRYPKFNSILLESLCREAVMKLDSILGVLNK